MSTTAAPIAIVTPLELRKKYQVAKSFPQVATFKYFDEFFAILGRVFAISEDFF